MNFVADELICLGLSCNSILVFFYQAPLNLYAAAGIGSAIGKVRKVMKEKIVSKDPSSSRLRFQVGGMMHYFFADDKSHHESKEIHSELIRLYRQMSVTSNWKMMVQV